MIISILDFICAAFMQICGLIFRFLPIRFTLWLGRQCGRVACFFNTARRTIGYANLRAAFCSEKTPAELKELIGSVYQNLVQTVFEIISLTKLDKRYVDKYIEIINEQRHRELKKNLPNGAVFLTAHFGNWEMQAAVSAVKGFPLIVLARAQKMKRINKLIDRLRESKGSTVIRKGMTTRALVKALHAGRIVGLVGDQDAGKSGIFVDFFGRPASTAPGAARIAQRTGAYFIPVFIARIKGPYHRLVIEEPVKIGKHDDLTPYLAEYNKLLEGYVRKYPEQYLWLHRRWKSTPLKRVLILDDGKAGHLNQAVALGELLREYREKQDRYKREDTIVEIVRVRFRSKFAKVLLQLCALFSGRRCQGCMRCLKLCLTEDSYDDLMKKYCDVVISCGSSLAAVNRLLAVENNAKNAVSMKPSILSVNRFDMVIMPWHDREKGKKDGHVIIVDTAPSLVSEEYLAKASGAVRRIAALEVGKLKIGVLLGGNNSDFLLTKDITDALLDNLVDASKKLDADLLFTTSRRTPRFAEDRIKRVLSAEKRCKFLVIANDKNIPDAAGGILGLSDIVVVSGESLSMVSEAIQSGRKVIVFTLKKRKRKTSKFERAIARFKEKNYIEISDTDKLSRVIQKAARSGKRQNLPKDRYNIYKYMWRLV